MSKIELVIRLYENTYDDIIKNGFVYDEANEEVTHAIKNGTPLPKGHGTLKDIGKCDRKLFYQQCGGADSLITVKTAFDMLLSLPTIIESNKEK